VSATQAYGIDIGGSGMKGALVDTGTGELLTERERVPTPQPSTPKAVGKVVGELCAQAGSPRLVGTTFPAIIQHGVARSAANVDRAWIGTDVDKIFTEASGAEVHVLNDADAAGLAEVRFGAARGVNGLVIVSLSEPASGAASSSTTGVQYRTPGTARRQKTPSAGRRHRPGNAGLIEVWAKRVNHYLQHVEALFTPDLFVLGGGVSKRSEKWVPLLDVKTPIRIAQLLNNAGIVGAAIAAVERVGE
jgi:polyphosphate glucokinase